MRHTKSTASYIETIEAVKNKLGYCRSVDVSREIWKTPGSTSIALKQLEKKWMITFDAHKMITLTKEAKEDLKKFRNIKNFLNTLFLEKIKSPLTDKRIDLINNQVREIYAVIDDDLLNELK